MAADATKVFVPGDVAGAVYFAVAGTTLPTDSTTALAVAFKNLGYISEEGVDITPTRSTNDIKAAQGAATVRTLVTSDDVAMKFTMLELNADSISAYFGSTGGFKASTKVRGVWVVHVLDGTKPIRYVVPDGEVIDRDAIKAMASGQATTLGVTVKCYPDSTGQQVYRYPVGVPV